jgi:hypothetical protein
LGVGAGGSADRPLRAQVIVALVCAAMLIAVPLYLWRKPSTRSSASTLASASALHSASGVAPASSAPSSAAPPAASPRLTLGAVQKVRCGASSSASPNEAALCDGLPAIEEALKKAILSSEDCAPKPKAKGSINYVLTVDFAHKRVHVYPGASGEWRGKQARRATSCVENAVKGVDLNVPHQYRFYAIAILASYAGPNTEAALAPSAMSSALAAPKPGDRLPSFE